MYLVIKNAHITFAIISISLFIVRAYWSVTESDKLQQRWAKILPHVNDTLLLSCAIYLMASIHQYPFSDHWLTAKFIALLIYIGTGTVAIKRGKTPGTRLLFSLLAVATFSYIIAVATTHSPWGVY
tara:strand:+ start:108360 stop:108737 length:378 start_codon:yes stop_codon:yes gene_type:complete